MDHTTCKSIHWEFAYRETCVTRACSALQVSSVCGDGERDGQRGALPDHPLPEVPGQLPRLPQPQPPSRSQQHTPSNRRYTCSTKHTHVDKIPNNSQTRHVFFCFLSTCHPPPPPPRSAGDSPTCSNGVTPPSKSKSHVGAGSSSVKYPSASSSASSSTSSSPSSVNYSESNSSDSTKPHSANSNQETR